MASPPASTLSNAVASRLFIDFISALARFGDDARHGRATGRRFAANTSPYYRLLPAGSTSSLKFRQSANAPTPRTTSCVVDIDLN